MTGNTADIRLRYSMMFPLEKNGILRTEDAVDRSNVISSGWTTFGWYMCWRPAIWTDRFLMK